MYKLYKMFGKLLVCSQRNYKESLDFILRSRNLYTFIVRKWRNAHANKLLLQEFTKLQKFHYIFITYSIYIVYLINELTGN